MYFRVLCTFALTMIAVCFPEQRKLSFIGCIRVHKWKTDILLHNYTHSSALYLQSDINTCKHQLAHLMARILHSSKALSLIKMAPMFVLICYTVTSCCSLLLKPLNESTNLLVISLVSWAVNRGAEIDHFYASVTYFHQPRSNSAEVNLITRYLENCAMNLDKMTVKYSKLFQQVVYIWPL